MCPDEASNSRSLAIIAPERDETTLSAVQFPQPSLQEAALGFLPGKRISAFVGSAGFRCPSQLPAEVGARRVRQMITMEFAARQERVD
jgi:hypothetical protein